MSVPCYHYYNHCCDRGSSCTFRHDYTDVKEFLCSKVYKGEKCEIYTCPFRHEKSRKDDYIEKDRERDRSPKVIQDADSFLHSLTPILQLNIEEEIASVSEKINEKNVLEEEYKKCFDLAASYKKLYLERGSIRFDIDEARRNINDNKFRHRRYMTDCNITYEKELQSGIILKDIVSEQEIHIQRLQKMLEALKSKDFKPIS
jgi:hypothetical protein